MDEHKLAICVAKAFGNLHRARCVLIAAQDQRGNILVGAKPYFFPPTITRLLGGGVDEGETFEQAAVRELKEELGVTIQEDDLTPLVKIVTSATDNESNSFKNVTVIYLVNIGDQPYQAGDDVEQIVKLSIDELHDLGVRYTKLPETLWYNGSEGLYSWADYAKLYGPVHILTAQKINDLSA